MFRQPKDINERNRNVNKTPKVGVGTNSTTKGETRGAISIPYDNHSPIYLFINAKIIRLQGGGLQGELGSLLEHLFVFDKQGHRITRKKAKILSDLITMIPKVRVGRNPPRDRVNPRALVTPKDKRKRHMIRRSPKAIAKSLKQSTSDM